MKENTFDIVEKHGRFILKPQVPDYLALPENEDLTMRLASQAGIAVPWHGLIRSKDKQLSYIVKRFDRTGQGHKIAVEDFSQLMGATRDTKYLASMERVAEILYEFCTYPTIEAVKLYRRLTIL